MPSAKRACSSVANAVNVGECKKVNEGKVKKEIIEDMGEESHVGVNEHCDDSVKREMTRSDEVGNMAAGRSGDKEITGSGDKEITCNGDKEITCNGDKDITCNGNTTTLGNNNNTPSVITNTPTAQQTGSPKNSTHPDDANSIPPLFYKEYALIQEMRKKRDAPVDSNGTECCADPKAKPKLYRYQTLIGLMLSSQTKDEVTMAAMMRLREFGLTPDHVQQTSEERLQELIKPVGFYRRKATYLKKTTDILVEQYDGDIPDNIKELVKLPGVGPKMGYLALKVAWNKVDGIGVDVHVHRICNRLEWVHSDTPEQTRAQLEAWLPRSYWFEINLLLVGFGQQICGSRPKCDKCLLKPMCPWYNKASLSGSSDIEDM